MYDADSGTFTPAELGSPRLSRENTPINWPALAVGQMISERCVIPLTHSAVGTNWTDAMPAARSAATAKSKYRLPDAAKRKHAKPVAAVVTWIAVSGWPARTGIANDPAVSSTDPSDGAVLKR